jgi:hypothetical protein
VARAPPRGARAARRGVAGAGKKIALGAAADDGSLQGVPLGSDLNTYLAAMKDRINLLEDMLNAHIALYNLHVHGMGSPNTTVPLATDTPTAQPHLGAPPALSTIVFAKP